MTTRICGNSDLRDAIATAEAVETVQYAVIADTEGDGKFYNPEVIRVSELAERQRAANEATDGNIFPAVLHTFELDHWMF